MPLREIFFFFSTQKLSIFSPSNSISKTIEQKKEDKLSASKKNSRSMCRNDDEQISKKKYIREKEKNQNLSWKFR